MEYLSRFFKILYAVVYVWILKKSRVITRWIFINTLFLVSSDMSYEGFVLDMNMKVRLLTLYNLIGLMVLIVVLISKTLWIIEKTYSNGESR